MKSKAKEYEALAQALMQAGKIAVLTGAGISTASGIPDFRSRGGIYDRQANVEYLLSETYFRLEPESFWSHFKSIFQLHSMHQYEPNGGHRFLRELETMGKQVTIITQNVDGLHRKAGSACVLEVHGTLFKAYCPRCGTEYGIADWLQEDIPRCQADGIILKPDVVLFEGRVKHMEEAYEAVTDAEVFLALGTSLQVYPVSQLPGSVRFAGHIVKAIVNKEPTAMDDTFDIVIHEDIVDAFAQVKALLV